jgi:hypothetical protein
MKFPHFIRSQKRLPASGLRDNNMQWDFWTLNPESAHQVTYLMGDRGLPKTWRTMNGYSSHTYMWINASGERFWVKYHFPSLQGVENLTGEEAEKIAARTRTSTAVTSSTRSRRGLPAVAPLRAGHALRGREDLPLQTPSTSPRSGRTRTTRSTRSAS